MFLIRHVFVGNLPLGACCYVCEEDCGSEYGLVDWMCCWCQRTVHSQCHIHIQEVFLFLNAHVFIYFLCLQLRLLNEKVYKVGEETYQT
jgi:diacylglycerol kinase (ATP)